MIIILKQPIMLNFFKQFFCPGAPNRPPNPNPNPNSALSPVPLGPLNSGNPLIPMEQDHPKRVPKRARDENGHSGDTPDGKKTSL